MTLLNTAAGVGNTSQDTTEAENIYAANAALAKPKKVSARPVEPVPFNAQQSQAQVDFAKNNAATGSVSNDSLVQNQLNKVLATDGPLLKRARTDGFASAAERGLNNSSMGVQAGEEAVIRQALQIATPDAQTYGEMDRANLSSAAGMAQTGVNQAFTDYNNDKNYRFTAGENKLGREHQTVLQDKNNAFIGGQNDADRIQKQSLFTEGNVFAAGENKLSREQQAELQKNDQQFTAGESLLSRAQQQLLQSQDQSFQSGEAATDRAWKTEEQGKQNIFASEQQRAAHGYQLEEINANADEQIRVAASQVDQRFQAQYLESATSLQRGFLDQQTAILNNPALKKDTQVTNALNVAKQNFESSVSYLQGLYAQGGVKVDSSAFPTVGPAQSSAAVVPPAGTPVVSPPPASYRQLVMRN